MWIRILPWKCWASQLLHLTEIFLQVCVCVFSGLVKFALWPVQRDFWLAQTPSRVKHQASGVPSRRNAQVRPQAPTVLLSESCSLPRLFPKTLPVILLWENWQRSMMTKIRSFLMRWLTEQVFLVLTIWQGYWLWVVNWTMRDNQSTLWLSCLQTVVFRSFPSLRTLLFMSRMSTSHQVSF